MSQPSLSPIRLSAILVFLVISTIAFAGNAAAQRVACKNPANNLVIVKKLKKCNKLGFSVINADAIGTTIKVYDDSFPKSLSSIGDVSGSTVFCPDGTYVTGGGASIVDNDGLVLKTSIPRSDLTGWAGTVQAFNPNATGTLNVYAICATNISLTPEEEEE